MSDILKLSISYRDEAKIQKLLLVKNDSTYKRFVLVYLVSLKITLGIKIFDNPDT